MRVDLWCQTCGSRESRDVPLGSRWVVRHVCRAVAGPWWELWPEGLPVPSSTVAVDR